MARDNSLFPKLSETYTIEDHNLALEKQRAEARVIPINPWFREQARLSVSDYMAIFAGRKEEESPDVDPDNLRHNSGGIDGVANSKPLKVARQGTLYQFLAEWSRDVRNGITPLFQGGVASDDYSIGYVTPDGETWVHIDYAVFMRDYEAHKGDSSWRQIVQKELLDANPVLTMEAFVEGIANRERRFDLIRFGQVGQPKPERHCETLRDFLAEWVARRAAGVWSFEGSSDRIGFYDSLGTVFYMTVQTFQEGRQAVKTDEALRQDLEALVLMANPDLTLDDVLSWLASPLKREVLLSTGSIKEPETTYQEITIFKRDLANPHESLAEHLANLPVTDVGKPVSRFAGLSDEEIRATLSQSGPTSDPDSPE